MDLRLNGIINKIVRFDWPVKYQGTYSIIPYGLYKGVTNIYIRIRAQTSKKVS